MKATMEVPIRILTINACAAIVSATAFQLVVGFDRLPHKPYLLLPMLAPLAVIVFELVRSRDHTTDIKSDQFSSFRASVLVSAALAASASLPKSVAKLVVGGCLVVAAAVLPLSTASEDSVSGVLAHSVQRVLMVVLTWIIVAVVLDHYTTNIAKKKP